MADTASHEPLEPWRRRADWVRGEIEEEGGRTLGRSAVSAALLTAIAAGFGVAGWFGDGFFWFFALVVGGVALALAWGAVRQTLQQRRFGRSVLVLQQTPLRAGERLAGRVRTGIPRIDPAPRFRVQLECVRRWKEEHGSGEDRETKHHREIVWSDGQVAAGALQAGPGGAVALAVPVDFTLPVQRLATTAIEGGDGIAWELTLNAELPGLDYRVTFALPMVDDV